MMRTEVERTDRSETSDESPALATTEPERRAMGRGLYVLIVIAAAVAVLVWALARDAGDNTEVVLGQRSFGEVVRTDLSAQDTYGGTLGRVAGEPILAASQGTITDLAQLGETVGQGETLYKTDTAPTVLLIGDVPMYRDLVSSESDVQVKARSQGTITWLPEVGTLINEGDVLFELDGELIIALYGTVPAYRTMRDERTDIVGDDVRQLEESLDRLGFVSPGEMTVDDRFSSATASVVKQFEEAIGATDDGIIALGDVVFIHGPAEILTVEAARVGDSVSNGRTVVTLTGDDPMTGDDVRQLEAALAELGFGATGLVVDGVFTAETKASVIAFEESVGLNGDGRVSRGEVLFVPAPVRIADRLVSIGRTVNVGVAVLAVTGQDTVVTVELPAADQGTLEEGMAVTVELPDGTEVRATVTAVATVASVFGQQCDGVRDRSSP